MGLVLFGSGGITMTNPLDEKMRSLESMLLQEGVDEKDAQRAAWFMIVIKRIGLLSVLSNCEKKGLGGMLFCRHGHPISEAYNLCAPPESGGYLGHVFSCPRIGRDKSAVGKAWGLCNPVHCEILLLLDSRASLGGGRYMPLPDIRILEQVTRTELENPEGRAYLRSLFTEDDLEDIRGGTLIFTGVDYSCEVCQRVVFEDFGIEHIVIVPSIADLIHEDGLQFTILHRASYYRGE